MVTDELRRYIAENLDAGYHPNDIAQALIDQGWSELDINHVFDEFFPPEPESPPSAFTFDLNDKTFLLAVFGGLVVALASIVYGVYVMMSGPSDDSDFADSAVGVENASEDKAEVVDLTSDQPVREMSTGDTGEVDETMIEPQDEIEDEGIMKDETIVVDPTPDQLLEEESIDYQNEEVSQLGVGTEENDQISTSDDQLIFAKNFSSCTPDLVTAGVDLGGFVLTTEKEILGWIDGLCHYTENQVMSGETYCKFTADQIRDISDQLIEIAEHDGQRTSRSTSEGGEVYTYLDSNGDEQMRMGTISYYSLDGGPEKIDHLGTLKQDPSICQLPEWMI